MPDIRPNDPRLGHMLTRNIKTGSCVRYTNAVKKMDQSMLQSKASGEIEIFMNWAVFEEEITVKHLKELAAFYEITLPKKATKIDVSLLVWMTMCESAQSGTSQPAEVAGHIVHKKGKLADRSYVRVDDNELTEGEVKIRKNVILTPQARSCLDIFLSEGTKEVTEVRMMEIVNDKRDRLRTRQDPWRIWQYYRPTLIRERFIRMV